ncbi:alpha/beta hydrolase [Spirulina sp. CS-785/01]|uniref:alpha/beta fold hydrolase n=1 Tax=Spirulina sp. CS-785/01 TaxID=3021716 RepID=UPI00232B0E6B|nr:alpha/beta hydrolase [Spirulina sp. CS-785/01]MDB9313023.1 alpha/beta hydrolase [Spirulina sp. CS-785/01]
MNYSPSFTLFAQHGWADTHHKINTLAHQLAPNETIITPDLGWLKTWWKIEPLIQQVEQIAQHQLQQFPQQSWRIIGHSMGGLIWLEVLTRHPQWWSKIHSLILIASPVGGADLAYFLDIGQWGISIAQDLAKNRCSLAEKIAQSIPTLSIAGDIDHGSDGTILVSSTQFNYAHWQTVPISHPRLKNHPDLIPIIHQFWGNPTVNAFKPTFPKQIREQLQFIPNIMNAHPRDLKRATPYCSFPEGLILWRWKHPFSQLEHLFLTDSQHNCLYGGFLPWGNSQGLEACLTEIQKQFDGERA